MDQNWTHLAALLWQEHKFKLVLLEASGNEFETMFTRLMRLSNPNHFNVSRAGGNVGDRACDGWDSKNKILYSVYAPPSRKKRDEITRKLLGDLRGARQNYPEMRKWRLVHNDLFGMHANVARALEDLRGMTEFSSIEILSDWGPQELWSLLSSLDHSVRSEFLGGPQWDRLQREDGNDNWGDLKLRFGGNLPESSLRPALRSLNQLCNNFEPGSAIDPICASAFAGSIVVWWLDDKDLAHEYLNFLAERSDESPMESQITSLGVLLQCITISSRQLNMSVNALLSSQLASGEPAPAERFALELAYDEIVGKNKGIRVDNPLIRFKFILSCFKAVNYLIGVLSRTDYPAVFALQDLIISLQRIDHHQGGFM